MGRRAAPKKAAGGEAGASEGKAHPPRLSTSASFTVPAFFSADRYRCHRFLGVLETAVIATRRLRCLSSGADDVSRVPTYRHRVNRSMRELLKIKLNLETASNC